jgi:hypothetical protein
MKKAILALVMALASVVGMGVPGIDVPGVDPEPAGAAIVQRYEDFLHGPGTAHSYHIVQDLHDNGVWHLKVGRYTRGFGQLLGIEVDSQFYSFACWLPYSGSSTVPIRIYLDDMHSWGGQNQGRPCDAPWIYQGVGGCEADYVWIDSQYKYWGSAGHYYCPYSFGTGHLAFGYYAPLFRDAYDTWLELW